MRPGVRRAATLPRSDACLSSVQSRRPGYGPVTAGTPSSSRRRCLLDGVPSLFNVMLRSLRGHSDVGHRLRSFPNARRSTFGMPRLRRLGVSAAYDPDGPFAAAEILPVSVCVSYLPIWYLDVVHSSQDYMVDPINVFERPPHLGAHREVAQRLCA